jgi:hypothetical protein
MLLLESFVLVVFVYIIYVCIKCVRICLYTNLSMLNMKNRVFLLTVFIIMFRITFVNEISNLYSLLFFVFHAVVSSAVTLCMYIKHNYNYDSIISIAIDKALSTTYAEKVAQLSPDAIENIRGDLINIINYVMVAYFNEFIFVCVLVVLAVDIIVYIYFNKLKRSKL